MSDKELAAAILPKSYGLSTIGVKKSRLCINKFLLSIGYIEQSSELSYPTTLLGSSKLFLFNFSKILPRSLGFILQAQPAPELYDVNFILFILIKFKNILKFFCLILFY